MPDIAMCINEDCPMAPRCYCHEARPSPMQFYAEFAFDAEEGCRFFWPMKRQDDTAAT